MGAYLSQPITDKETEDGGDESGLRWGAAGMQGWRTGMEDSHLVCLDLARSRGEEGAPRTGAGSKPPVAAFAVFDGHGGAEVAKYCAEHICDVVKETQAYKEGDLGLGLKQTFLRMDELLKTPAGQAELLSLRKPSEDGEEASDPALESGAKRRCGFDCGATAVMGLLVGGKTLVVANAGDSRCVVSRKGTAVEMSTDHKPEDDLELARIEKAGGAVVDGRVQGNLNLSRAIGDLMYKVDEGLSPEEQMITADPELRTLELTDEDEFIVLACDGVWNSLSSQETIDFVRERLKGIAAAPHPTPLSKVCADLCDACCAETADGDGTGFDNVTAVVIELSTAGAFALTGRRVTLSPVPSSGGGAAASGSSEGEGSGDVDMSDDGKRKQGGNGEGRSGKQMRAAVDDAGGGGSGGGSSAL